MSDVDCCTHRIVSYVIQYVKHIVMHTKVFACYRVIIKIVSHPLLVQTQGPIPKICRKIKNENGGVKNFSFFESAILNCFFPKMFFLFHSHENQSKSIG